MKLVELVEALVAAKASPEAILAAVRVAEADREASAEKTRARLQRYKDNHPEKNVSKRSRTLPNVPQRLVGEGARVEDKTSNSEIEPQGSKGVAKARPTRLPENFQMPDEWRDWAIAKGLPPERVPIEFEKLCNWAANAPGSKGAKSNWFRAWQNWVIEAIDKLHLSLPRSRAGPVNGTPSLAQVFGMVREKAAEDEQRRDGSGGAGAVVLNLPAVRAQ